MTKQYILLVFHNKLISIGILFVLILLIALGAINTHEAIASRPKKEKELVLGTPDLNREQKTFNQFTSEYSIETLIKTFDNLEYELNSVISGAEGVPRVFISTLPVDIEKLHSTEKRKLIFIKSLLPLILKSNGKIEKERNLLKISKARLYEGKRLSKKDYIWLDKITKFYDLSLYEFDQLLIKHDIIPPSLALAQAIIESGWGTSRFARNGNAVFGQWTYKEGAGIIPLNRVKGQVHEVRSFKVLEESVDQYIMNLNYHRAYKDFRGERAKMRQYGQELDGYHLAKFMNSYSQKGDLYIKLIRSIIISNSLDKYDMVRLRQPSKS